MLRFRPVKIPCPIVRPRQQYSYGILAEEYKGEHWVSAAIIPDIICSAEQIEKLAEICTNEQISPMQLLDIVVEMNEKTSKVLTCNSYANQQFFAQRWYSNNINRNKSSLLFSSPPSDYKAAATLF